MSQNRSSAVMQQRSEPHESLDFFPTPPWATRALLRHVLGFHGDKLDLIAWEPACGEGDMARVLSEYFRTVAASDVHDYGFGYLCDFLFPPHKKGADWIITNPPFRLAQQFIAQADSIARVGFAMLVRVAFLEGVARYRGLFAVNPPSIIAQFSERVPMFKGRLDATGSTATAYCWLVWNRGEIGTEFKWIPPCRRQFECEGDYA